MDKAHLDEEGWLLQMIEGDGLADELAKNSPWLRSELRDLDRKAGSSG